MGVLVLYHAAPRTSPYAPGAIGAIGAVASLAGLAIANAQAHQRKHAVRARLEALDEASKALAVELSPVRVLQRIVDITAGLVGARYGALGVVGDDGYLTDFIATGLTSAERERIGHLPRGHGLLGALIRHGQPLRVANIGRDPRRVGFPPHHPPMTSLLGVPIRVRARVVGDLYLADKIGAPEFSADDQALVELLAAHAGIAIENAHLYAKVGELTALKERERIGRDLHDGIIGDIYAAALQLEDAAEDVPDAAVAARLLGVADGLSAVIGDVRAYIQGLRARELDGHALSEGIAALVRDADGQGGLEATFDVEGKPYRPPDELANTVLQIAREALSNVVRHARAHRVRVRLAYAVEDLTLTIADDGRGFDPHGPRGEEHRGLRNPRARTEEIGGALTVDSAPGHGATISAWIPAQG